MKKLNNKGFTLVELIIVIAILAIIMLIAIPNFSGIQQRMQVRADKSTAAQIGKAVRVWFTDFTTDSNMVTSTKAITDATGTNKATTAPVGKSVKYTPAGGSEETVTYIALPSLASDTATNVTPISYEKLVTIDEYISRGQKPTSLRDDNAQVADQLYGIFLSATADSTSAKIGVVIGEKSGDVGDLAEISVDRDTTTKKIQANYDGTAAGVAYIEP